MNKRKNRKSEQIKEQTKRPKKHLLVESNFASFLTGKDYKEDQLHINKKRTLEFLHHEFNTFKYLAESKKLDQEYKNKLFPSSLIDSFFQPFQYYDRKNTEDEEQNKLHIAIHGIQRGINYLNNRYEESAFVHNQMEQLENFLQMFSQISVRKADEKKAIEFYKLRHSRTLPPTIRQHETRYVVMCRICWGHEENEDKDKAISRIRHSKKCPYDKNDLETCIEVILPKNLRKKH